MCCNVSRNSYIPKNVSKSPANKNIYFKRDLNTKTLVIFVYHLFLLPLYALKDQLDEKLKNFQRLFLGKTVESNSLEYSYEKMSEDAEDRLNNSFFETF